MGNIFIAKGRPRILLSAKHTMGLALTEAICGTTPERVSILSERIRSFVRQKKNLDLRLGLDNMEMVIAPEGVRYQGSVIPISIRETTPPVLLMESKATEKASQRKEIDSVI